MGVALGLVGEVFDFESSPSCQCFSCHVVPVFEPKQDVNFHMVEDKNILAGRRSTDSAGNSEAG